MQQRGDDPAQPRHGGYEAQRPEDAERPQHRDRIARRHQRDRNHDEIEQSPRVAEEPHAVGIDAQRDLDDEDDDHDLVEQVQFGLEQAHHRRRCLETERDRVDHDQGHDRFLEQRILDQPADGGAEWQIHAGSVRNCHDAQQAPYVGIRRECPVSAGIPVPGLYPIFGRPDNGAGYESGKNPA